MTDQSVPKMMNSLRATYLRASGTLDVDLSEYVSWGHPVLSSSIYIRRSIVHLQAARAQQSFKRKPSSEIGGLLFGKFLPGSPDPSVLVTDTQFINSEGLL